MVTAMAPAAPTVHIVAGSNGAGKSTFAMKYLAQYAGQAEFINADLIAQGLSPLAPEISAVRAGRLVLRRIEELRVSRMSFAFETTLSGRSYANTLRRFKADGYRLSMFYLWIPNTRLAIQRIRNRVKTGGHNIPASTVKRRFGLTLWNLFNVYYELLDELVLLDNSGLSPIIVAEKRGQQVRVYDQQLFEQIRQEAVKHG